MKLDRNINADGSGKYALLKIRRWRELEPTLTEDGRKRFEAAFDLLHEAGILDPGDTQDSEFFVIRLKDRYSAAALEAYADAATFDRVRDLEYAGEVREMARRAGPNHPNCKNPD